MKFQPLSLRKPLPNRHGLSPSSVWLPKGDWATILAFLCDHFRDITAQEWITRLEKSEIVAENGTIFTPRSPYQCHTHLFYYRELSDELEIPFQEKIIYEDEELVVADKPHFLPTVPAGRFLYHTLLIRLQNRLNTEHLVPIHRLDRETAGVVAFAKVPANRGAYQTLFSKGLVHKTYEAIAPPLAQISFPHTRSSRLVTGEPFFRMQEGSGKENSTTTIDVIEKYSDFWRYSLHPATGKKHQLRVHMSALGAPLLNDPFYPHLEKDKGADYSKPLQLLAKTLRFTDPLRQIPFEFTSTFSLPSTHI